jgi:hypothetical protein
MGRPRELTEEERQELIAKGYKPVEVWVRDVANEAYKAEAHRQAQSAAHADVEDRVMEWIEAVSAEAWDDL